MQRRGKKVFLFTTRLYDEMIFMHPLIEAQRAKVLQDRAMHWPFGPGTRVALVFLFQLSVKYYATG